MSQDKPVLTVVLEEIERIARQAMESGDGRLCLMMSNLQANAIIRAIRIALDRQARSAGPASGSPDAIIGRLEYLKLSRADIGEHGHGEGPFYEQKVVDELVQSLRALETAQQERKKLLESEFDCRMEAEAKVASLKSELDRVRKDAEKWTRARVLLAQFALGYDTFNEPETCLNWHQVEQLVKETRTFLTTLGERG